MREVSSLKVTNTIIYVLSLLGSFIYIIIGFVQGDCVDRSEYSGECYEWVASPNTIAAGVAGILFSTLLFQVISVFAAHVERSHTAQ